MRYVNRETKKTKKRWITKKDTYRIAGGGQTAPQYTSVSDVCVFLFYLIDLCFVGRFSFFFGNISRGLGAYPQHVTQGYLREMTPVSLLVIFDWGSIGIMSNWKLKTHTHEKQC